MPEPRPPLLELSRTTSVSAVRSLRLPSARVKAEYETYMDDGLIGPPFDVAVWTEFVRGVDPSAVVAEPVRGGSINANYRLSGPKPPRPPGMAIISQWSPRHRKGARILWRPSPLLARACSASSSLSRRDVTTPQWGRVRA